MCRFVASTSRNSQVDISADGATLLLDMENMRIRRPERHIICPIASQVSK